MRHTFRLICILAALSLPVFSIGAQEAPVAPTVTAEEPMPVEPLSDNQAPVPQSDAAPQSDVAPQPDAAPQSDTVAEPPPVEEVVAPSTPKQLYKSVDAQGRVVFTDVPPANRPSEPIKVQNTNTVSLRVSSNDSPTGEAKVKPVQYTVTIISPVDDEALGQEVENVTLNAQTEPGLQEGHTLQLYYDGKPVGNGESSYTVTELYRGTHTVEAKVFDKKKKVLSEAVPIKFHARRISKLNDQTAKLMSGKDDNDANKKSDDDSGMGAPADAGGGKAGKGAKSTGGANGAGGANGPGGANSGKGVGAKSK